MADDRLRKVWETVDAIACAVVVLAMAWLRLCSGRDALWSLVAISAGRSGLLMVNAMLLRLASQLGGPGGPGGGPAAGGGVGSGDRPATPPPPPTPPQLPTSPLAILFALFTWASKLGIARLAPIAVVAALVTSGCGPAIDEPKTPPGVQVSPVRRAEVRGAILVLDRALDAAILTCAHLDVTDPRSARCEADLRSVQLAEQRADLALYAWEVSRGPVRCALVDASAALADIAALLADAGVVHPPAILSDGLDALRIVDRIEDSSCQFASVTAANDNSFAPIRDAGDGG